jgi:hypothetical protein
MTHLWDKQLAWCHPLIWAQGRAGRQGANLSDFATNELSLSCSWPCKLEQMNRASPPPPPHTLKRHCLAWIAEWRGSGPNQKQIRHSTHLAFLKERQSPRDGFLICWGKWDDRVFEKWTGMGRGRSLILAFIAPWSCFTLLSVCGLPNAQYWDDRWMMD